LGFGFGVFGVGASAHTPQPQIPNPQSPIPNPQYFFKFDLYKSFNRV